MRGRSTYEDDGHVIADMSGIERQRLFIPQIIGSRKRCSPATPSAGEDDRPWESTLTPEERRITIMAAVKAALLIALVFIVGLGAAIELMVLIW